MRNQTREEILRGAGEQIKAMVKELLELLMQEERTLYLKEVPPRLTGTTPAISSPSPALNLKILPYRRHTSLELSEVVLAFHACGVSTRN